MYPGSIYCSMTNNKKHIIEIILKNILKFNIKY